MIQSESKLLRAMTVESPRVLEGRPSVRLSLFGYCVIAVAVVSALLLIFSAVISLRGTL